MRTHTATGVLRTIADATHIDEIGIRTGRWRGYFIKSAYRPLYVRSGDRLRRAGFEASIVPIRDGRRHAAAQLWSEAGDERGFLEALCLALHIGNHANIGDEGARLVVDCRVRDVRQARPLLAVVAALPGLCAEQGLEPEAITCLVGSAREATHELADLVAHEVDAGGMRVALDDFGAGRDVPALLSGVRPHMVRLDGRLFDAIRQVPQGRALLAALVDSLHDGGIEVALGTIASRAELEAALSAGVDLMGGPLLGDPALAGTLIDGGTIDLAPPGSNVVYLRR